MQDSKKQDDHYNQDQITSEEDDLTEEELEQERKDQIQRRIKARQQFRSPWFILGIIAIVFVVVYPRCSYKENIRKDIDRQTQNQAEMKQKHPQQTEQISNEQQGMVPKF